MAKTVLLVSIGFPPNVGGIETHFQDLITGLVKRNWRVMVLTYQPLTSKQSSPFFENSKHIQIIRLPIVRGLFYTLVKSPIWEFLYLEPALFIFLPILLLSKYRRVDLIHSHGLIAGFASVFWGKLFKKKVITTTHSVYGFGKTGLYTRLARWIFASSDHVLTLSRQSKSEIENLGIEPEKIKIFTYWIDLDNFKKATKSLWQKQFVVLFVGRLIEEKGILPLLQAAAIWNTKIKLAIAGIGPLENKVKNAPNVLYLGKVEQTNLPRYYSSAKITIVPSVHEEGFGRVIIESLACGTPVIGAQRGAIPEAMNAAVGKLIEVSSANIKNAVESLFYDPAALTTLAKEARHFAIQRYSEKNINVIINCYED